VDGTSLSWPPLNERLIVGSGHVGPKASCRSRTSEQVKRHRSSLE